jgi:hypothetical protein
LIGRGGGEAIAFTATEAEEEDEGGGEDGDCKTGD